MSAIDSAFAPNMVVRLRGDPGRVGVLQTVEETAGRAICTVRFVPGGTRRVPCAQLEVCPRDEDPIDLLGAGRFVAPHALARVLMHIRIAGRLADMFYSMEASDTDFLPYQFKPVLKMLNAPTGGLLIADEVGLGKTIEAGLIWTELTARDVGDRRLLVLCPAALRDKKWCVELSRRFHLDARPVGAEDLLGLLEDGTRVARGFVAVASMQGLRPPRGWNRPGAENYDRPAARLGRLLESRAGEEPLFDLLVVDEAHHLRNPETGLNKLGHLLRPLATYRLFLSATPIHLRSRDLFSLLTLLDPDMYSSEHALTEIIDANRPLVRARDVVLGDKNCDLRATLDGVLGQRPSHGSGELRALRAELDKDSRPWSEADRARVAEALESANLLGSVISRTRRREVAERKVVRKVSCRRVAMTACEREVYDRVGEEIADYAKERGTAAGFLYATPARLLASSIPAAVAHWRNHPIDLESDDLEDPSEFDLDFLEAHPLVARLTRLSQELADPKELAKDDTKFEAFLDLVRDHLREYPNEKLIVFSSFRPTLRYLTERLTAAQVANVRIDGETPERDAVLARFHDDPRIRVLLSSEVGSEGIDLQFCHAIVNYDLPWNPMRIEQRVGRIDRIGQEAEAITVLNLLHQDTIDDCIYTRLTERLQLIEGTLGDFEEILGEEVQKLTVDLLAGTLTPEEEAARVDQAKQALANNRRQSETLERDAAELLAHGDAILARIRRAHEDHRWVGARDLASYLRDALEVLFPGCMLHERGEDALYDIRLTGDARLSYAEWARANHYPAADRLQRETGPVLCQLGRPERKRRGAEAVTLVHPFVRFISTRFEEQESARLRPAVAARIAARRCPKECAPGQYCVLAAHWRFKSEIEQERIVYAGLRLESDAVIDDSLAEALARSVAEGGEPWSEGNSFPDLAAAETSFRSSLVPRLDERFSREAAILRARQADRVAIQLRTLEHGHKRQRDQIEDVIRRQRQNGASEAIIRANEGRLRKLDEQVARRKRAIEARREVVPTAEHFAALLIDVT